MPIVNSSAYQEGNYFSSKGVRITAGNQPNIEGSVIAGMIDSSIVHDAVNTTGIISSTPYVIYTGHDRRNVVMSLTNTLRGAVDTDLRSPGSEAGRESIHALDALRTEKVATAIRAGDWHQTSGVFVNAPGTANDFSSVGADRVVDDKRSEPGQFVYTWAGSGVQQNYDPRTQ